MFKMGSTEFTMIEFVIVAVTILISFFTSAYYGMEYIATYYHQGFGYAFAILALCISKIIVLKLFSLVDFK